jgi:hypothetical protein
MNDAASRRTHRVQMTTDGHKPYLEAVEGTVGADIDYAMLVKSTALIVKVNHGIARRQRVVTGIPTRDTSARVL